MKLGNLVQGITILQKYFDEPDGHHCGADHDIFYIYPTNKPVSDEDVGKLKELNWFQPDVEEDDDENAPYDAEESWAPYV